MKIIKQFPKSNDESGLLAEFSFVNALKMVLILDY